MSGEARELFAALHPRRRHGALRRGPASAAARVVRRDHAASCATRTSRSCSSTTRAASARSSSRPSVTDEVASEWLIRGGDRPGVQARRLPGAFAAFVREHADRHRGASASCCPGPAEWSPTPLTELRQALDAGPGALHRGQPAARLQRRPPQGAGRHHLDGQARGRRAARRC